MYNNSYNRQSTYQQNGQIESIQSPNSNLERSRTSIAPNNTKTSDDQFDHVLDSMIEDVFLIYDDNDDGVLQKEEIEEFVEACLKSMESEEDKVMGIEFSSPDLFDDFFEKYDTNGDGVISKEELKGFLRNVVFASVEKAKETKI